LVEEEVELRKEIDELVNGHDKEEMDEDVQQEI
jgi:hypothetical protein